MFEALKAYLQYDKYGPLNDKILFQVFMHIKTIAELEKNLEDADNQLFVSIADLCSQQLSY